MTLAKVDTIEYQRRAPPVAPRFIPPPFISSLSHLQTPSPRISSPDCQSTSSLPRTSPMGDPLSPLIEPWAAATRPRRQVRLLSTSAQPRPAAGGHSSPRQLFLVAPVVACSFPCRIQLADCSEGEVGSKDRAARTPTETHRDYGDFAIPIRRPSASGRLPETQRTRCVSAGLFARKIWREWEADKVNCRE